MAAGARDAGSRGMKMDFTILKSFIAVAEEKSFSAAAKHLFISQQSLSKQIAKLEEELDTPYFTEADTVLICRKLYAQEMSKDCMLNDWVDEKWYPNQDYHTLYIAAIEKVMVKQELV